MTSSILTWSTLFLSSFIIFHGTCMIVDMDLETLPVREIFSESYPNSKSADPVLECGPLVLKTFENMRGRHMLSIKEGESAFRLQIPYAPPHSFLAENRANLASNHTYAVKEIPTREEEDDKAFKRLVDIHNILNYQGCTPNLLCYFTTKAYSYLVMPLIEDAVSLENPLHFYSPLKENLYVKWANLCIRLVHLVQQLHTRKVTHLNLSRDSFLLRPDGRLYIVGFSKARKLKLLHSTSDAVAVPEIKENPKNYSELSDVYLLGDVFHSIYNSMRNILSAVALQVYGYHDLEEKANKVAFSPPSHIIEGMKNRDPKKRLTTNQVIDLLVAFKNKHEK